MYKENPKESLRPIFFDNWLQSSLAVVALSARSALVLPSMNVIGNIIGFLDLVDCKDTSERMNKQL